MATTILDTILNPKYQKEFMFKNIDEKIRVTTLDPNKPKMNNLPHTRPFFVLPYGSMPASKK